MRKVFVFLFGILIFSVLGLFSFPKAYSASFPPCAKWVSIYDTSKNPTPISPKDLSRYKKEELKCASIDTAIGNISTEPAGFVRKIFGLVLGLAGGIALILIIISGYRLMASQGNPEAVQASRDQLISAIVGLLFIIFSFVILQVIGVDILKIPGFK